MVNGTASEQPRRQQLLSCSLTNHCWFWDLIMVTKWTADSWEAFWMTTSMYRKKDFCSLDSCYESVDHSHFKCWLQQAIESLCCGIFLEIKHAKQVSIKTGLINKGDTQWLSSWKSAQTIYPCKDSCMSPRLRSKWKCALLSLYLLFQIVNGPFPCSLLHHLHQRQKETEKNRSN